jgi:DNA-binding response OmpR family regulator
MDNNSKKIVLLVEDDTFVSDIYTMKLTAEGFNVVLASNGMEALKKLEELVPDIILLDVIMPYVSGMEVLHKIKSQENLKKIPVILLTNVSEKEKIEEALGIGADDYLIKSHFTPSEVLAKINSFLKK